MNKEPNEPMAIDHLLDVATIYTDARKRYRDEARRYVRSASPLGMDDFWARLARLRTQLVKIQHAGQIDVKRAVDRFHYDEVIRDAHTIGGTTKPLVAWELAARWLASYQQVVSTMNKLCFKLPGIEKGDDGYGDFMDALPLAGREVVEGIESGRFATYDQVGHAVGSDPLRPHILEGENYICMHLEDDLIERLASIATMERARQEEVAREARFNREGA